MTAKVSLHELVDGLSEAEARRLLGELADRKAVTASGYLRADGTLDLAAVWALSVEDREIVLRNFPAEVDLETLAQVQGADTDVVRHIDE